jgi:hypothetical protein
MFNRKRSEPGLHDEPGLQEPGLDEAGTTGTAGDARTAGHGRTTGESREVDESRAGESRETGEAGTIRRADETGETASGRDGFDDHDGFDRRDGLDDRHGGDRFDGHDGFDRRDSLDDRDGRETWDGHDGLGHRHEAVTGERLAGVDEELPRSAAGEAEDARSRAGGTGRGTGDLYGDRERVVRRERALRRERESRDDAARHATAPAASGSAVTGTGSGRTGFDKAAPAVAEGRLMPRAESDEFGRRLQGALTHFVDDPGRSVEEAARVLEEAARRLSTVLEERPRAMRATWDTRGAGDRDGKDAGAADTERLRLALRTYRETTERLLEI